MTELSIRRMPSDDENTKRAILQIPLTGKEEVIELKHVMFPTDLMSDWEFDWITPVQISEQYTGVPASGFTFIVRPEVDADDRHRTQLIDVFYQLKHIQTLAFGGVGRIVYGGNLEGKSPEAMYVMSATVAFMVQFKRVPDEDTEDTLTHKFQQS